ncbi:MAG TPA: NotI family restriction endonuclease [Pirellulales bacterium]|nr:NotI family restriction endonuclease [Pirellulales bacterium]
MTKVAELYGLPTFQEADWIAVTTAQQCPFLSRKCLKNRKSEPDLTIGTCTMTYGRVLNPVMICPFRLLERSRIFTDCLHLLTLHEPGNEIRIIPELNVPGGSIDYCLVSVREGKPRDFVGIELQTLDSTGTVWPERQRFLRACGIQVRDQAVKSNKRFGMNWKMTAKTILVQLHHKITTFEHLRKHMVLVTQDCLLEYMRREFNFDHIMGVRDGDSMHFHAYELLKGAAAYRLVLKERVSTDDIGIGQCLGLQVSAKVELRVILSQIEAKLPQSILLTIGGAAAVPVSSTSAAEAAGDGEN